MYEFISDLRLIQTCRFVCRFYNWVPDFDPKLSPVELFWVLKTVRCKFGHVGLFHQHSPEFSVSSLDDWPITNP